MMANPWGDYLADGHEEFSLRYLLALIEDEDEDNDELEEMAQFLATMTEAKNERNIKWKHQRLNWNEHVDKLVHEESFAAKYRMSLDAFNTLLELLRIMITPNLFKASNLCDEPIYPEMVMAIGLRWLGGGSHHDLMDAYNLSKSSVYRSRDTFLDAVIACNALEIRFPQTPLELEDVRKRFAAKSTNNVMRGCVGALDGLLARINQPSNAECEGNPRSYHSGHYNDYGLNVQAICDARLRFLFFAVAAPGGTGDLVAYEFLSIRDIIEGLPDGIYIVADAAYMLSEHVLVPFTGGDRQAADFDTFNYFLSQLRIRIEMAFGLFTTKWRVVRRHLETKLTNSSKVLEACARLHNFVIDQDSDDDFDEDDESNHYQNRIKVMDQSPLGWGYLPTVQPLETIPGTSRTRDAIVRHVSRNGYRRPAENVERRIRELHELEPPLM